MKVHITELSSRLLIVLRNYFLLLLFGFAGSFLFLGALDFEEHLDIGVLFSTVWNDFVPEDQLSLIRLPDL